MTDNREDLYLRAWTAWDDAETERCGVDAVVDLVLAEHRQANVDRVWDVLRKAADAYEAHVAWDGHMNVTDTGVNLRQLADELEGEHRRETAQEALIEKAADEMRLLGMYTARRMAVALADAGLLREVEQ